MSETTQPTENAQADSILDITTFRIDLPEQAASTAFMAGRAPDLVNFGKDCIGIAGEIERFSFLNMATLCALSPKLLATSAGKDDSTQF